MQDRRLVGIDLGITSAHTVRVLGGDGTVVCRRKALPTVESLGEVEQAALTGATADTRLEIVIEPTGPAWLPIAVFFSSRGTPCTGSARPRPTTCAGSSGAMPSPTASTPTPWPASRWSTRPGCTRWSCRMRPGRRWTAACGPATGSPRPPPPTSAASRTWSASCCRPAHWSASSARPTWPCWNATPTPTPAGRRRSRLARLIAKASNRQQGARRATQWLTAAKAAVELYADHPAIAVAELAAEVHTQIRLLRATQAELAAHATQREACYQQVDPDGLARSLPGLATIGGPALTATMGPARRFATAAKFRAFTGLAPRASETGQTDRKGQPISKAGNRLLGTTLVRAADHARRQDPQLARIYHTQMVQRGKDHLGALCVVPAHLGERAWAVMDEGTPYVLCDTDGTPVTPAQAKAIIAQQWTVPEEVRRRRRAKQGKAPQQVHAGHVHGAHSPTRRPSPPPASLGRRPRPVKPTQPQP